MENSTIAAEYAKAGLSIIPTQADKKPALPEWSSYQKEIAGPSQVQSWFSRQRNIAVIAGKVSGNLEILDFDCQAEALEKWTKHVMETSSGLVEKLILERSPKGGHVVYRCTEVGIPGNTKLARKYIEVDGSGQHAYKGKKFQAQRLNGKWCITPEIIETRGEAGYCLIYPSKGYELKQGDFLSIPTITAEERNILIEAALSCNEWTPPQEINKGYQPNHGSHGDILPGQDFDDRGDLRELLQKHGWTFKRNGNDGRELWARPGKDKGHSATLTEGKIFYCFSSNGHPFEQGKAYGPFAVYATLKHNGDFKEATKALASQGYGSKPTSKHAGRKPRFLNVRAMEKEFGQQTEMLWKDLIPKANPCLFGGAPGVGKSSNVAQICKEIVLLDKRYWILWVATEGFVSDHADKWSKLRIPDRVVMLSDDKGVYKLQLDSWKDREFLDQSIEALKTETDGRVVAVVIDSIRGMQSMGENDPKLASVMSAINSIICDKHKAAAIYIAHHKKGKEEIRLNRVAGSTGITSSVRGVYTVERISEFVCRIIPDKSNTLGHNPKSYKSVLIQGDDGYEIAIVEDVIQDDETARSKAEKFLIPLFKEQTEYPATEIYKLGALEGLSSDTLKKAKSNLPIKATNNGRGTPWIWQCLLYKQNPSLSSPSEKEEEKKPNKINERDERDEGDTKLKKTEKIPEGDERDLENSTCLPQKNPIKSMRELTLSKHKSENTREGDL